MTVSNPVHRISTFYMHCTAFTVHSLHSTFYSVQPSVSGFSHGTLWWILASFSKCSSNNVIRWVLMCSLGLYRDPRIWAHPMNSFVLLWIRSTLEYMEGIPQCWHYVLVTSNNALCGSPLIEWTMIVWVMNIDAQQWNEWWEETRQYMTNDSFYCIDTLHAFRARLRVSPKLYHW